MYNISMTQKERDMSKEGFVPTTEEIMRDNLIMLKYRTGVQDPDQLSANLKKIFTSSESELKEIVAKQPAIKSVVDDVVRLRSRDPAKSSGVLVELAKDDSWRETLKRAEKKSAAPINLTRGASGSQVVFQGDTRGLAQRQGLHTPTIEEIIAQGNQRDPAAPYFDTNSDHMRVINPLESHYDLSGDFPKLVNPLKPGPKISNLG